MGSRAELLKGALGASAEGPMALGPRPIGGHAALPLRWGYGSQRPTAVRTMGGRRGGGGGGAMGPCCGKPAALVPWDAWEVEGARNQGWRGGGGLAQGLGI